MIEPEHGIYEVVPEERLLPLMTAVRREASQLGIALSGYIAQLASSQGAESS